MELNFLITLKGDHPRIISVKFVHILPSRLGRDVILIKIVDRRRPMDNGYHRITIAHLEPMAKVS